MFQFSSAVFLLSLKSLSLQIICNEYDVFSGDLALTNCTGAACVTFLNYGFGCASNVFFANRSGCYGDEGKTICSCKNDDNCVAALLSLRLVQLRANVVAREQTSRDDFIDGKFVYSLTTEFHSSCVSKECVILARKLRKEEANSSKPSVECYTYFPPGETGRVHNVTCQGDYCYHQEEYGTVTRGCYTVDDTLSNWKISVVFFIFFIMMTMIVSQVGLYQYFQPILPAYLCDKDLCNENEHSARRDESPEILRPPRMVNVDSPPPLPPWQQLGWGIRKPFFFQDDHCEGSRASGLVFFLSHSRNGWRKNPAPLDPDRTVDGVARRLNPNVGRIRSLACAGVFCMFEYCKLEDPSLSERYEP
ncbi:hypothetical protein PRIPAC_82481 [Pristionchus pacificus]|uniref:DUF7622 domain-containing protein n=1 Tax=Pristionchus pacificus TaxID=54126 RepID=A0A2A6CL30_PRIPA|nr:hypothetical protein PRIPAC_82481 [Pristionchus pacificus]|eukprot:PDM78810.1 hypothetical protein PRIPAC_31389 [Pristionchus pacificus]